MKVKKVYIVLIGLLILLISTLDIALFYLNKFGQNNFSKPISSDKISEEDLHYADELVEAYTFELGNDFPVVTDYTDNKNTKLQIYYNADEVKKIDTIGTYKLLFINNDNYFESQLVVNDTKAPNVSLNSVTINYGEKYEVNDFISSIDDCSKYSISFLEDSMAKYKNSGTYNIKIRVTDEGENQTIANTTLTINKRVSSSHNSSSSKPSSGTSKPSTNKPSTNKPSSGDSSNNSSGTTNNNDNTNKDYVVLVKTERKEKTTKEVRYGTVINKTVKYYVNIYSDGSTKEYNKITTYDLNYSGFKTSTKNMLNEATNLSKDSLSKRNDMLKYVNKYRAEAGVGSLVLDEKLSIAATIRAMELAYTNVKYQHKRPNGESYKTVINEVYGESLAYGENLVAGTMHSGAKSASESLRKSSAHYENMIHPRFKKLGVGFVYVPFDYKYYWVQLFVE